MRDLHVAWGHAVLPGLGKCVSLKVDPTTQPITHAPPCCAEQTTGKWVDSLVNENVRPKGQDKAWCGGVGRRGGTFGLWNF
jgi:hypothetical protein